MLTGCDDQRALPFPSVVQRTDRVAEAWAHVNTSHADLPGCLRVRVRHGHHNRLLQRYDVLDLRVVRQGFNERQLRCAGIAKDVLHTLIYQRLHYDLSSREPLTHCTTPFASRLAGRQSKLYGQGLV